MPGVEFVGFNRRSRSRLFLFCIFKKSGKGSTIGLGAIPPSAKKDVLDGVSVRKVISTRVLSFATVRTFHFGKGVEGDAAIRALILAVLLRDIYQGSDSGGRPEEFPSLCRLYSALVSVAYLTQLPHRGFDGHIRVGSYKGESTSKAEEYVKARNSTLDNLLPIFELSPETVIFGGWDSTRSKNQLRIPSVMVGETYAILAEQEEDPVIHRAGGRIDPVGASVIVSTEADRQKIVGDSIDLSDKTKTSLCMILLLLHSYKCSWHITSYIVFI